MNDNETISAKLRRWTDESEAPENNSYPSTVAELELSVDRGSSWMDERELFRRIADEVDADIARARVDTVAKYAKASMSIVASDNEWPEMHEDESVADYVNRCFLPRPLFEDGEPVQLRDEFVANGGSAAPVTSLGVSVDGVELNPCAMSMKDRKTLHGGERVKRPESKVLDADGVPIEVGETVWSNNDTLPWKVVAIKDGYPILKRRGGEISIRFYAGHVSHREPDSFEKLRDDMRAHEADEARLHTNDERKEAWNARAGCVQIPSVSKIQLITGCNYAKARDLVDYMCGKGEDHE